MYKCTCEQIPDSRDPLGVINCTRECAVHGAWAPGREWSPVRNMTSELERELTNVDPMCRAAEQAAIGLPTPMPPVCVKFMRLHPGAHPPRRMTADSAATDIAAFLPAAPLRLEPGARAIVRTGLVLAIPSGYEGQLRPRSGRALRDGLMIVNSPATIDADFRGELQVLLLNAGGKDLQIGDGERIAQLVIAPLPPVEFVEATSLDDTVRGGGGFGSTGR